jgi:hypothetical protein
MGGESGTVEQEDQTPLGRRGILPNPAAVIRRVGAILLEQDDEWAVTERRYFSAEFPPLDGTLPPYPTRTCGVVPFSGRFGRPARGRAGE